MSLRVRLQRMRGNSAKYFVRVYNYPAGRVPDGAAVGCVYPTEPRHWGVEMYANKRIGLDEAVHLIGGSLEDCETAVTTYMAVYAELEH